MMPEPIGKSTANPGPPAGAIAIIERVPVTIGRAEKARLAAIADDLLADEPALAMTDVFGPKVRTGLGPGPMVLIGDLSEIPLLGGRREPAYEYRIALLAQDNDILILSGNRNCAFEAYLKDTLNIGSLQVIVADDPADRGLVPLAKRCLQQSAVFDRLMHAAYTSRSLSIVPHITTGHAWKLAHAIAQQSGAGLFVCGPPPRLSRRVNDKLWFADCVTRVLGPHKLPLTRHAFGPAALAGLVSRLAECEDKLVVKIPDSAGSAGNLAIQSALIRNMPVTAVRDRLIGLLVALGWRGRYPLLVEVWDEPIVSSPSVQTWIPLPEDGEPVVEGIFEQVVEGPAGEFTGAVPASMPEDLMTRLARDAFKLALVFQRLGYFGRCSFDGIIKDPPGADGGVHWIECNGRWGGVSLPMTLANRLFGAAFAGSYAIVQREGVAMPKRSFAEILQNLTGLLYDARAGGEGIILLTTTGLERGSGLHFMAVAPCLDRAKAIATQASNRLIPAPGNRLSRSVAADHRPSEAARKLSTPSR
jgi:hypothetical protein